MRVSPKRRPSGRREPAAQRARCRRGRGQPPHRHGPRPPALVVQDGGPGIPPEVLDRVGEPFFSTKSPGAGLGLGVFIARSLCEQMGGRLTLESSPGRGTTARVEVPGRGGPGRSAMTVEPRPPRRLLIVEDDDVLRGRLARAFRERGFEVREAADAADAARRHGSEPPDYALVDLRLPDALRPGGRARASPLEPAMTIVVLTGYGEHRHRARGRPARRAPLPHQAGRRRRDPRRLRSREARRRSTRGAVPESPTLARVEWEHINRVLADCGGNVSEAARDPRHPPAIAPAQARQVPRPALIALRTPSTGRRGSRSAASWASFICRYAGTRA